MDRADAVKRLADAYGAAAADEIGEIRRLGQGSSTAHPGCPAGFSGIDTARVVQLVADNGDSPVCRKFGEPLSVRASYPRKEGFSSFNQDRANYGGRQRFSGDESTHYSGCSGTDSNRECTKGRSACTARGSDPCGLYPRATVWDVLHDRGIIECPPELVFRYLRDIKILANGPIDAGL